VDGAIASLDALPPIAEAVGDRVEVLFDSGVRTGADVLKALALGARAVLVGRPWVYGLALGGTDGVDFCRALPQRCGVVAVPTQVFYDDVAAGRHLIRFAFCKRPEVLDEAVARLRKLAV